MNCNHCGAPVNEGQRFCTYCGNKIETQNNAYNDPSFITFENLSGQNQEFDQAQYSSKSKILALFFALFIGFGSHSFYLGHTKKGIIQLVVCLVYNFIGFLSQVINHQTAATVLYIIYIVLQTAVAIWFIVEAILILAGKITDKNGRKLL